MPYVGGSTGFGGGGGGNSANLMLTDQNYQQIKRVVAPNVAIPVHSTSEHMQVGVGSDDIVATIYGLPPDKTKDLLPDLEAGDYNNGNSGCLVGSTFATDHNVKVGSRMSIGTDGQYGTLRVTGIIKERGMSFDISTDSAIVVTQDWFESTYNDQDEYNEVVVKVTSGDTADVKTTIENQRQPEHQRKDRDGHRQQGNTCYHLPDLWYDHDLCHGHRWHLDARCRRLHLQYHDDVSQRADQGDRDHAQYRHPEKGSDEHVHLRGRHHRCDRKPDWGILSLLGGYAISALMLKTTEYLFSVSSMMSVVEGVSFGIIISVLCGLYPAWQAANLNPIDALRHE